MPRPKLVAQPIGKSGQQGMMTSTSDRSRSPCGAAAPEMAFIGVRRTATFTGVRAGVFVAPSSEGSSDDEVVAYVGENQTGDSSPMPPMPQYSQSPAVSEVGERRIAQAEINNQQEEINQLQNQLTQKGGKGSSGKGAGEGA